MFVYLSCVRLERDGISTASGIVCYLT